MTEAKRKIFPRNTLRKTGEFSEEELAKLFFDCCSIIYDELTFPGDPINLKYLKKINLIAEKLRDDRLKARRNSLIANFERQLSKYLSLLLKKKINLEKYNQLIEEEIYPYSKLLNIDSKILKFSTTQEIDMIFQNEIEYRGPQEFAVYLIRKASVEKKGLSLTAREQGRKKYKKQIEKDTTGYGGALGARIYSTKEKLIRLCELYLTSRCLSVVPKIELNFDYSKSK